MYSLDINHKEPSDLEDIGYMVGPIAARLCQLARINGPTEQFKEMTRQVKEKGRDWDLETDHPSSVFTQWVLKMWPELLINFAMSWNDNAIVLHADGLSISIPVPPAVVSEYLDAEMDLLQ